MAVRRRRPLVPPPYPRRNRYTPVVGANSTHSVSVGKLSFAPTKTAYRFVAPPLLLETASPGFSQSTEIAGVGFLLPEL